MSEVKKYTMAEVAQNDGSNGSPVWLVLRDFVYDVTSYMDGHPGGADLILEWAGQDGTLEFRNAPHSQDAKEMLKQYKIGELLKPTDTEPERPKQEHHEKVQIPL